MNRNWFVFLGLLGFLGFLGLFTDNVGFFGFYGFFGFFGLSKIVVDERFSANINKATRNTFIVSILFYVATILFTVITQFNVLAYAFAINFALLIIVFTFSFHYYDRKGE